MLIAVTKNIDDVSREKKSSSSDDNKFISSGEGRLKHYLAYEVCNVEIVLGTGRFRISGSTRKRRLIVEEALNWGS